jgi:hypothetical protein
VSQAQVQPMRNRQTIKIFRLKYPYYVTSNNKIGVVLSLRKRDGEAMAALLDPARIKKVMVVAVPSQRPSPSRSWRKAVVVTKDRVFLESFTSNEELEELRKQYPDAVIYPDSDLATYIAYETNNDYYKPAELDNVDGAVVREGALELLKEEKDIQPCGRYGWRVYLYEIGKWDNYCFDLATAFNILMTGIHPVYGVMD